MRMYVCIMYVYMYVCCLDGDYGAHVCTCMCMYVCMYVCCLDGGCDVPKGALPLLIRMYVCMYVCIHVCMLS
jgi:hypothetical protein